MFDPRAAHVGAVVDEMVLGASCFQVLRFCPANYQSIIAAFCVSETGTVTPFVTSVPWDFSLTPPQL
jgi:hypothetical protein